MNEWSASLSPCPHRVNKGSVKSLSAKGVKIYEENSLMAGDPAIQAVGLHRDSPLPKSGLYLNANPRNT
jgi:hypothetical protein